MCQRGEDGSQAGDTFRSFEAFKVSKLLSLIAEKPRLPRQTKSIEFYQKPKFLDLPKHQTNDHAKHKNWLSINGCNHPIHC